MPRTVHILPRDDLVAHESSNDGDCVCGPETQPVEQDDGGMDWLIVHAALDGREPWTGARPPTQR